MGESMMLSQDEYDILKEKMKVLTDKRNATLALIEKEQKNQEATNIVREELNKSKKSLSIEERNQNAEIKSYNDKIHIYQHGDPDLKKKIDALNQQLENLENVLASHVEKIDFGNDIWDNLTSKIEKLEAKEKPLLVEYAKAKELVAKYLRYMNRLPAFAPVVFMMEDYENRILMLKEQLKNNQELKKFAEERIQQEDENTKLKEAEITRLGSQHESVKEQIRIETYTRGRLYTELSGMTSQIDRIGVEMRDFNSDWEKKKENYGKEDEILKEQIEVLRKKNDDIQKDIDNFPEILNSFQKEESIRINKKKQLADQLQKKIYETIQQIIYENNQSPHVMELNSKLSKYWIEHQKILDKTNRTDYKLQYLVDELERKKKIAIELKKLKVKGAADVASIEHVDLLFKAAMRENKKLAKEMNERMRNLQIFESEQKQFIREYEELTGTD